MAVVRSNMTIPEAKRGGKLVVIPVPGAPSRGVKMYEGEALARGLLPAKPKDTRAKTKKRTPQENK